MDELSYTAVIELDDGAYHAYVPALPGCHTFGDSIDEARTNLLEAAQLHLEAMREAGEALPEEPESLYITQLAIPIAS